MSRSRFPMTVILPSQRTAVISGMIYDPSQGVYRVDVLQSFFQRHHTSQPFFSVGDLSHLLNEAVKLVQSHPSWPIYTIPYYLSFKKWRIKKKFILPPSTQFEDVIRDLPEDWLAMARLITAESILRMIAQKNIWVTTNAIWIRRPW